MQFYDNIARFYDDMTRLNTRLDKEIAIFRDFLTNYPVSSALDVACGSGLHTIVLNKLGIKTTGVDISEEMLTLARKNARVHNVKASFFRQSMQELDTDEKYNALLCLGNSIPHLDDQKSLENTLKKFKEAITPDGYVIIQLLNFTKILANKERIVAINEINKQTFVRFYDFEKDYVQFNILAFNKANQNIQHTLNSTRLFPFTQESFQSVFSLLGIDQVEYFGDLQHTPFNPSESNNLVVIARCP